MSLINNDSDDYQLSEECLEERKKRFPETHLYILFHIECGKIEKAEKREISCYERTNRWIEFKAKHGPSNVDSESLTEISAKDMDDSTPTLSSKKMIPKSSLEQSTSELSLEPIKTT